MKLITDTRLHLHYITLENYL